MDTASTKPTSEEKRQKRNERNRLYYATNKETIRKRRATDDVQKRKNYYLEHKETICEKQRNNYKKRHNNSIIKQLTDLSTFASDTVKYAINKLLETPERVNKNDINCVKKLIEMSVEKSD
jgi:hypothetical protein